MTQKNTAKTKKQTVKKKPEQKSKKAKSDNSNHKKELDLLIKNVKLRNQLQVRSISNFYLTHEFISKKHLDKISFFIHKFYNKI